MKQQYSSSGKIKVEGERATRRESGGHEVLIEQQQGQEETGKQVRCGKRVEKGVRQVGKKSSPVDAGPQGVGTPGHGRGPPAERDGLAWGGLCPQRVTCL